MAIFIATLDEVPVIKLSVQLTVDKVHHVCTRIMEATHIPVQRQQLLFAGKKLQHDGHTLSEIGLVGESTLHLVGRG